MSADAAIRAVVPCRACLSGEDLDWLGGRSVSVALDLTTTVEVLADEQQSGAPDHLSHTGRWETEVWAFLRNRLPGLGPLAPATRVSSNTPAASGLSSSTALIVALFQAYLDAYEKAGAVPIHTLAQWAYEFEFAIFNGGGMDHLAVIAGGALLLEGSTTGLPEIRERVSFPRDWSVMVMDSATPKSTGDHIRSVRAQLAAGDPRLAEYMASTDAASGAVWRAIRTRDIDRLGAAMSQAHAAMRDLQEMSTPLLERLRDLARRSVGLPLKVSGAGGGGALVGICPTQECEEITGRLRKALQEHYPDVRVIPVRAAEPRAANVRPRHVGTRSGGHARGGCAEADVRSPGVIMGTS